MSVPAETKTAGASQTNQSLDINGKLVEYSFYMQKQGYSPETVRANNG